MDNKKQKVAIVTGASRGIGKAIALKLDKEGFITILVSRSQKNLNMALKDFSKRAIAIPADVSKETEVISAINKIIKKFGRIDVLVNNAGWSSRKEIEQIAKDDFKKTVGTNLAGTFYCTQKVIRQMKRQTESGQIINISSLAAKQPHHFPLRSIYCASKAAVAAMAASLQSELVMEGRKIKIATIYPALVFTETEAARSTRDIEDLKKHALRPQDIAHIVLMIVNQGVNSNITEVVVGPLQTIKTVSKS